jgi:hypothetical protein
MKWGDFVAAVEAEGVTEEDEIESIDFACIRDSIVEVEMHATVADPTVRKITISEA